jgi:PAS domain S-box-containing protein
MAAPPDIDALRQSEERFRLLVSSVRDYAIFLLDPAGHVASWNEGAERIKGYRAAEILGRHFSAFYPPEAIAAGTPEAALRAAAEEGHWEGEGWRLRRDGSRFWADAVLTALHDETGALVGYAKVTRDLTERRRAQEERVVLAAERAARQAAETALRERETFLAAAAHELRTPLTSLRGFVQLLGRDLRRAGPPDPERAARALARVEQQTDRLSRLIARLLDTTRLDAGLLDLVWGDADLAAVAADAVRAAELGAGASRLGLAGPAALPLRADALRLEQVLVNLVDNALKYAPEGPISVEVDAPDALTARVRVRDRGPGVPPEHRARLFQRFAQVPRDERQGGLGLGLYLSRQIAERHGGRLEATFPPEGGSCFTLTLPRRGDHAAPDA